MSDYRTLWAHAIASTHLEPHAEREVAIDRIGAAARGPYLGRLLWRVRYGGDPSQAYPALCELVRLLCEDWSIKPVKGERRYEMLVRTARQALHEWYWPTCRVCRGAREFVVGDRRVDCPTCEGTGVHRYSDHERRDALMDDGATPAEWETWSKRLTEAISKVRSSDAAVAGEMHYQLRVLAGEKFDGDEGE